MPNCCLLLSYCLFKFLFLLFQDVFYHVLNQQLNLRSKMGKNGNRCVIKSCPVGDQSCPGFQDITYHIVCRTSKNGLLRRNAWQKTVGPSVNLFNGAYICSLHFAPEDFNVNKRTTLKPDALPKYYLDPQWESVGVCDGLPLNTSQSEEV